MLYRKKIADTLLDIKPCGKILTLKNVTKHPYLAQAFLERIADSF